MATAKAISSLVHSDFGQIFSKICMTYGVSSLFEISNNILKHSPVFFDIFHNVILAELAVVLIGSKEDSPNTENIASLILAARVPRFE